MYITFQIILRLFKTSLLDASFVDFVELLGMLIKKAYPYLWFELQAHSSFYLRGLTLCVPQKVCFVLKILYGNWILKHFPQYSHFKSSNIGETIYQGLFSFSVCWIQSCFESSLRHVYYLGWSTYYVVGSKYPSTPNWYCRSVAKTPSGKRKVFSNVVYLIDLLGMLKTKYFM